MKNLTTSRYIVSLVCVAILSGGGVYLWQTAQQNQQTTQPATETTTEASGMEKIQSLYDQVLAIITKKLMRMPLIEGALQGMTDALDDPYTTYLNQSDADNLDQSLSGSFEGIGSACQSLKTIQRSHKRQSKTRLLKKVVCV